MAVYSRGSSGRADHRNSDDRSTVSSARFSHGNYEDKAPDNVKNPEEKNSAKRAENQLARLAEELFGSPADTDKLLVAALVLLLLKEGADPKLILALGYIFL